MAATLPQDATIAATEQIVDSWNSEHPETQIDLVQGSWDNVHDQLVTLFTGEVLAVTGGGPVTI